MKRSALLLLAILAVAHAVLAEESAESLADALAQGKATVDLCYRFELVDDDALQKEAQASTLRTALGWKSGPYEGFSLFAEVENVTAIGNDLYNNRGAGSRANGVTDRPVVADPALTELNQAGLRFQNDAWQVTLGRQEIVLGDARFVGNVGWRQNHQSYDALRIENDSLEGVHFSYGYIDRVHRIFGDSQGTAAHLLNAVFDAGMIGKLTFYGHLLDYRDPGAAGGSTATWGAELAGKRQVRDDLSLLYELEYALQSDYADNPGNVDAGYSFVMLGAALPRLTTKLGWEVLEGSPGDGAFRTPLATLHKFNGWADKFLATPATGLEDLYLQLNGTVAALDWLVRYHDFDSESGGIAYGSELDLQLLYRTPWKVAVAITGALYDADRFSTDTEKWMLWATYSF